jgi:hypothetical protein
LDFRVGVIDAKSGDTDNASAGRPMVVKTMSFPAAQTKTLLKTKIKTETNNKTGKKLDLIQNSANPGPESFFIFCSPFSIYLLKFYEISVPAIYIL